MGMDFINFIQNEVEANHMLYRKRSLTAFWERESNVSLFDSQMFPASDNRSLSTLLDGAYNYFLAYFATA